MKQEETTIVAALVPLLFGIFLVYQLSRAYLVSKSPWAPSERKYLKDRWASHPLLNDLRKVRHSRAGRMKIVKHLLTEANIADGVKEARFLSPNMLYALEENVHTRWLMVRTFSDRHCHNPSFRHTPQRLDCLLVWLSIDWHGEAR